LVLFLFCCTHLGQLLESLLMWCCYSTTLWFDTTESAQDLVREVGGGFGSEGLGQQIGDLIIGRDILEMNSARCH
jgi:hypothetical protein